MSSLKVSTWDVIVYLVFGGACPIAIGYLASKGLLSLELLSGLLVALALLFGAQVWRYRSLAGLVPVSPQVFFPLKETRGLAMEAQRVLADQYHQFHSVLLSLFASGNQGRVSTTYAVQMQLAAVFHRLFATRFWATSLDSWSVFYSGNHNYIAQMNLQGRPAKPGLRFTAGWRRKASRHVDPDLTFAPAVPTAVDGEIPYRARLFLLAVDQLAEDMLEHPVSMTLLAERQLDDWRQPLRVYIYVGVGEHGNKVASSEPFATNVGPTSIVIPDFMVVDSAFVFGRIDPEMLSGQPLLEHKEVELGLILGEAACRNYEKVFLSLWRQSLTVDRLAELILTPGEPPLTVDKTVVEQLRAVIGRSDQERRVVLERELAAAADLVRQRADSDLRDRWYRDFVGLESVGDIDAKFVEILEPYEGPVLAFDQAEVKGTDRFWQAWEEGSDRWLFRCAMWASSGSVRRRILVVRSLPSATDDAAFDFIRTELRHNIAVGLITRDDLKAIADGDDRTQSALKTDCEWIILGPEAVDSRFVCRPLRSIGMDVGMYDYKGPNSSTEERLSQSRRLANRLPLEDRQNQLLAWHHLVWFDIRCRRFETPSQLYQYVNSTSGQQEAAPSSSPDELKASSKKTRVSARQPDPGSASFPGASS